jgi:glycosyltransferase involved in cell wall biosynthesis
MVFPRFSANRGRGGEARRLLVIALAVVAGLSGLAGLALFLAPYHVLLLLFGHRYGSAASTLRILAFSAAATALTSIVTYFHLARRSSASLVSWAGMIALTIAIVIAHSRMTTIAWSVFGCSVAVFIAVLLVALASPAVPIEGEPTGTDQWKVPEQDQLDVTIVIPYYNPGPRLRSTVEQLLSTLSDEGVTYEVITVSDGSTDGSEEDLRGLPADHVRSIRLAANQGKGAALRLGLALGRGRYLGFIDADGDLPASQMASFISLVRSHSPDLVIGSKRHPMSEVVYPPLRRIYSAVWQVFSRLLFRLNVRDTQTGLKLVKREVLEASLPRMLEKRFAFDLELIVVANRLGFKRTFEAPVVIIERFGSTVSLKSVWRTFVDSLAIFYRLRILHYYDEHKQTLVLPEFYDLSLESQKKPGS